MPQITNISKVSDAKYTCSFFDGKATLQATLVSQVATKINKQELCIPDGALVRVEYPTITTYEGQSRMIVTNLNLVDESGDGASVDSPQAKRQALAPVTGAANKPVTTPTVALKPTQAPSSGATQQSTPLLTPSPSAEYARPCDSTTRPRSVPCPIHCALYSPKHDKRIMWYIAPLFILACRYSTITQVTE